MILGIKRLRKTKLFSFPICMSTNLLWGDFCSQSVMEKKNPNITTNAKKEETFKSPFLKSRKPSRPAYQKLIVIKTHNNPVPCQQKWNNALQEENELS